MWCLALYLPLLIGTCVPEDDEYWNLLCLLLQIVRIVFSPTINKDQVYTIPSSVDPAAS